MYVLESWCSGSSHFDLPRVAQDPTPVQARSPAPTPQPHPTPATTGPSQPRTQTGYLQRTASTSQPSIGHPSRPASASRLGRPIEAHVHHLADPLEYNLELLMNHYLGIVAGRPANVFEQPKGVNSIFVKVLCIPTGAFDVHVLFKAARALSVRLAYVVMLSSFLLVPAWLWVLRASLSQGIGGHCIATVLLGLLVFLGSDALVKLDIMARTGNPLLTASSLPSTSAAEPSTLPYKHAPPCPAMPSPSTAPAPSAPGSSAPSKTLQDSTPPTPTPASAPATPAPAPGATVAAPAPAGNASSAAQRAVAPTSAAPAAKQTAVSSNGWGEVRRLVIALEFDVFGNELTEGVLPSDVLPSRVERLCEEVGVAYPTSTATPQSLLEALRMVQNILGR